MYKAHGRLKPASKKEVSGLKDRYFKCDKCDNVTLATNIEFAETKICSKCGGTLYEFNPYKSKIKY